MLGLSATGSSSALWWGIGEVILVASVVVTVGSLLLTRLRGLPPVPWDGRTWTRTALAIPLAAVAGAMLFDGPLSLLAVTPILTLACGVGAERSGARRRTVAAISCAAAGTVLIVLFCGGTLNAGLSALIQGSVVSGAFVALLVAGRVVIRRWRR